MSKLVQTCPNLSKLVQTCQNWSKLVQTSPNMFKLVQTCSQTWSNLFTVINVTKCENCDQSHILQSSSLAFPNSKHDVRCFQSPNVESRILQSAPTTECGVWFLKWQQITRHGRKLIWSCFESTQSGYDKTNARFFDYMMRLNCANCDCDNCDNLDQFLQFWLIVTIFINFDQFWQFYSIVIILANHENDDQLWQF